jgi:hypothetical protein
MIAQNNRVPLPLKAIEDGTVETSAVDAAARSHRGRASLAFSR